MFVRVVAVNAARVRIQSLAHDKGLNTRLPKSYLRDLSKPLNQLWISEEN
jgi:hypothetical protein